MDLNFSQPTRFDDPCEARRKKAILEKSQARFVQWLKDKSLRFERLKNAYRDAVAQGGPEGAVAASAHFALVVSRFDDALSGEPSRELEECTRFGFHERSTLSALDDNAATASELCYRLANTFAIDSGWAAYCRSEHQRQHFASADWIHEISPSEIFMTVARDDADFRAVEIAKVDSPPKPRPRPAKRPCLDKPDKASPILGVLRMSEKPDPGLTRAFERTRPFADDFPAILAKRFPPLD